MSFLSMGKTVLGSLFKRPYTTDFPYKPRVYHDRTRGHIEIDIDACIFCGMCKRKCPSASIEVTKADKQWSINRLRCVQCNGCVEVCPKKCLEMKNTQTAPSAGGVLDTVNARAAGDTADN